MKVELSDNEVNHLINHLNTKCAICIGILKKLGVKMDDNNIDDVK